VIQSVEIDTSAAIKQLRRKEAELRSSIDKSLEQAADKGMENARTQLFRQGSVATETGVRSIEAENMGDFEYMVKGRSYLVAVDEGTKPHTPDTNIRLIEWAKQEGWNVIDLIEHIEQEGTKPHPANASWRRIAFEPVIESLPQKIAEDAGRRIG